MPPHSRRRPAAVRVVSRTAARVAARVAALVATAVAAPAAGAQPATLIHEFLFTNDLASSVAGDNAVGTLVGGASLAGGALHLSGTTAYADFAPLIPVVSGAYVMDTWSVSVWARQRVAQPEAVTIVGQGAASGYLPDYNISVGAASNGTPGAAYAQNRSGWGGGSFNSAGDALGEWHHYVTVGSWSWITLYVDGVAATWSGGNGMYPCCYTSQSMRLGRQVSTYDGQFDGDIDDLRIYTGTLTAGQIAALGDAGRTDVGGAVVTPEPSSYALLSAGMLALGAAVRRRRRG